MLQASGSVGVAAVGSTDHLVCLEERGKMNPSQLDASSPLSDCLLFLSRFIFPPPVRRASVAGLNCRLGVFALQMLRSSLF